MGADSGGGANAAHACEGFAPKRLLLCGGFAPKRLSLCEGFAPKRLSLCEGSAPKRLSLCEGFAPKRLSLCEGFAPKRLSRCEGSAPKRLLRCEGFCAEAAVALRRVCAEAAVTLRRMIRRAMRLGQPELAGDFYHRPRVYALCSSGEVPQRTYAGGTAVRVSRRAMSRPRTGIPANGENATLRPRPPHTKYQPRHAAACRG